MSEGLDPRLSLTRTIPRKPGCDSHLKNSEVPRIDDVYQNHEQLLDTEGRNDTDETLENKESKINTRKTVLVHIVDLYQDRRLFSLVINFLI